MRKAKVIFLSLFAACLYGILHDQITARICIEYFTVAHPPLFPTVSPTLLALCWGIAATSGVGVALGLILALVSQGGEAAPWPISRIARSVAILLGAMAVGAGVAGILGYRLSQSGLVSLPESFADAIPVAQYHRFMAVWFAHGASYLVGLSGGAFLCWRVWKARGCPSVMAVFPHNRLAALRVLLVITAAALILWFRFR